MWNLFRSPTSFAISNPAPKNVEKVESNDETTESSKPLKKAVSMDALKSKPINVKKRNGSVDEIVVSHGNWLINEKVINFICIFFFCPFMFFFLLLAFNRD